MSKERFIYLQRHENMPDEAFSYAVEQNKVDFDNNSFAVMTTESEEWSEAYRGVLLAASHDHGNGIKIDINNNVVNRWEGTTTVKHIQSLDLDYSEAMELYLLLHHMFTVGRNDETAGKTSFTAYKEVD